MTEAKQALQLKQMNKDLQTEETGAGPSGTVWTKHQSCRSHQQVGRHDKFPQSQGSHRNASPQTSSMQGVHELTGTLTTTKQVVCDKTTIENQGSSKFSILWWHCLSLHKNPDPWSLKIQLIAL